MRKSVEGIVDFLQQELNLPTEKREVLVYALQIVFLFVGTFLGIILVAFLVSRLWKQIFWEAVITSLATAGYRFVSGGFHFKNYILCMAVSSVIPTVTASFAIFFVENNLNLPTSGWGIMWLLMMGIALLFAPRQVEERPIGEKETKKFKGLSVAVLVFWGILVNLLPSVMALAVLLGLSIQTVIIVVSMIKRA